MLKVSGGVVSCGRDYHCENLYMKYASSGAAFDENFRDLGYKYQEISFTKVASGIVPSGRTYSISVPNQGRYYDLAVYNTTVSGGIRAEIWHNHYSWGKTNLEFHCGWL